MMDTMDVKSSVASHIEGGIRSQDQRLILNYMIEKSTPGSFGLPSSLIIPIDYQKEGAKNPDDVLRNVITDDPWYLSDDDEGGP